MERPVAWMRTAAAAAAAAVLMAGCGGGGGTHSGTTPGASGPAAGGSFVGIYSDDVFFGNDAYKRATLPQERRAGVQIIRQPFAWADFAKSPAPFDAFVGAAARAGIRVLPTVLGPEPGAQAAGGGMAPPRDPAAFVAFAAALVHRYGPHGSFWSASPGLPKVPITDWEIWNEPNIPAFWASGPDPAGYARLLAAAGRAVHEADPHATVISAGLPDSSAGMPAAKFLDGMYRAGAKGSFDVVGAHPYAATPQAVLRNVDRLKAVIDSNHDQAGMWVTEVGWGTGGKPGPFTVSRATQARYLAQTLDGLAARRAQLGLRGIVVFQWRDPKPFPGRRPIWPYYAGLLAADGSAKPGLASFSKAAARLAGD